MMAVHFTTIPCQSNIAHKHVESHNFGEIPTCIDNIVYATLVSLKILEPFFFSF